MDRFYIVRTFDGDFINLQKMKLETCRSVNLATRFTEVGIELLREQHWHDIESRFGFLEIIEVV